MGDNRIHYLDGLRGVLALIVFIHHFLYIFYPELMLGGTYTQFMQPGISIWKIIALTPVNLIFNSSFAINFFFLLSGYVQSYHYFKNPDLHLVQTSFIKRYFRLAIPTLAVLLLVFMFRKLHFIHKELLPQNPIAADWVRSQMPDTLNFFQLVKFALSECFQGSRGYYQVLWTMPIELMNSWLVLILLFVTHRMKPKTRNYFFVTWFFAEILFFGSTYSLFFVIGLLICSLHTQSKTFMTVISKPAVKYVFLLVGIYFASFPFIEYQDSVKNSIYGPISHFKYDKANVTIGLPLLFCVMLTSPGIKTIFSKTIFQFFGAISFMFYLSHFLLLFSFSGKVYFSLRNAMGLAANLTVTFLLTFFVITGISYLLYRYVDKPCLRYCNRVTKKLFGMNS